MGKIFISYARENKESASVICNRLKELGFDPWIDTDDLAANDDITTVIDEQIAKVDAVLVLWSSAAKASTWVRGEALSGFTADKYIGALLEPVVPPTPFMRLNAPDLSDWTLLHDHRGWQVLVRGLAAMSAKDGSKRTAALEKAIERERAKMAAEVQAQLPLAEGQNVPDEELPPSVDEHVYSDVDSLVLEARQILSASSKLDLDTAIVQAALDQEMLRDAAFVVTSDRAKVSRPEGSNYAVCASIGEAVERAADGDLIVVASGRYSENVRLKKRVRIVGLGREDQRPTIIAAEDEPTVAIDGSARLENLKIASRRKLNAIHFVGGQPVLLRCDVTRFAEKPGGECAIHVAARANPIMMATSVTSKACDAMHFVGNSAGTLIGVDVTAQRGIAISCRGRPEFRGCHIEAVGGHAVEVRSRGYPTFDECSIEGRGATVVKVVDARPRMNDSRVKAIRQIAFDFEGETAGRFERNIVDSDMDADAGTPAPRRDGMFGFALWKPAAKAKDDARVVAARRSHSIISLRSARPPIFVANKTADGSDLNLPPPF